MTERDGQPKMGFEAINSWREDSSLIGYLKGERSEGKFIRYVPMIDVDQRAEEAGVSVEDYFEEVQKRIGDLGAGVLSLVKLEQGDGYQVEIHDANETIDNEDESSVT